MIAMIRNWPQGNKTFFMLNSAEHEILTAHKYLQSKLMEFAGSNHKCKSFILLMPVVGVSTFILKQDKFHAQRKPWGPLCLNI